jgi:hypothetical protein
VAAVVEGETGECMNKLQIIYKNHKPYGIRSENGYLFFFADIPKFYGQEDRYSEEIQEQFALADYLLAALQARTEEVKP